MANYALLNNIEHKDLKIITEKSVAMGNSQMYSVIYPFEFRDAQAYYPIYFQKTAEGDYFAIALFGFEKGENLYLTEKGWNAEYIPLMVEKDPFAIGFQNQSNAGGAERATVIHIDMDSPRISQAQGQPVFLPHGGNSDYLARISAILKTLYDGQEASAKFIARITELELLEGFNLDIRMRDDSINRLSGFYTVNEEKLRDLSGDVLQELSASGMLMLLYMVLASQANIRQLAARKHAIS